jgi:TonB family protein
VKNTRPAEEPRVDYKEKAPAAQIGWEGAPRTLLARPRLSFPKSLREYGLETECEARITVSPSGTVVQVEITKSSGYIEIDANVETALRGYVFARDYGFTRKNAVGNVRIRFRLEKPD